MNVDALRDGLAAMGARGEVDECAGVAILVAADPDALRDPELRSRAVSLARELGFATLALDLGHDGVSRAALPGT